MSACPHVRLSACPRVHMSACPRFPPNRKYGQLRFEQGFEVFEIHPQRYEKLSLYIIYVTLDISMQYEIRLGKFMQ